MILWFGIFVLILGLFFNFVIHFSFSPPAIGSDPVNGLILKNEVTFEEKRGMRR